MFPTKIRDVVDPEEGSSEGQGDADTDAVGGISCSWRVTADAG